MNEWHAVPPSANLRLGSFRQANVHSGRSDGLS